MAKWTTTPEGRSVALLTPEEDKASTQARENKDPTWAYFHVDLNFATNRPGTWVAHLGEKIGDRLWEVLKGGGCWWCDENKMKSSYSPPHIKACVLIYGDHRDHPDKPPIDVSEFLGLEPTQSGSEKDYLFWQYSIEENTWEAPELLDEIISKFDPAKVKELYDKYKLHTEVSIKATVTNSYPVLVFGPGLLADINAMGAFLDIDIIGVCKEPNCAKKA